MDFTLTDEQRLIQDTVRAFVDERVLPVAVQNDIDHKLDLDLIEGMAELGILGIVIPSTPSSAMPSISSMSSLWSMSFWTATGRIRSSTNRRTVSWMSLCSSVRSKSMRAA